MYDSGHKTEASSASNTDCEKELLTISLKEQMNKIRGHVKSCK
jgi:hypothetical protein